MDLYVLNKGVSETVAAGCLKNNTKRERRTRQGACHRGHASVRRVPPWSWSIVRTKKKYISYRNKTFNREKAKKNEEKRRENEENREKRRKNKKTNGKKRRKNEKTKKKRRKAITSSEQSDNGWRARRPSSYGRRAWSADATQENSFAVSCFVSCLEMLLQVVTLFVLVESFCDGEKRPRGRRTAE